MIDFLDNRLVFVFMFLKFRKPDFSICQKIEKAIFPFSIFWLKSLFLVVIKKQL